MVAQEEVKPDEAPPETPKPADEPPPIGTNNAGSGPPDGFGLGAYKPGSGNGSGIGGTGRKGGSKYGYYAAQVQGRIAEAMRKNDRTRMASFSNVTARIWVDKVGRIERAKVLGSNGTPSDQDLIGLQLTSPPPDDMPMPIVLRLNARKPTS